MSQASDDYVMLKSESLQKNFCLNQIFPRTWRPNACLCYLATAESTLSGYVLDKVLVPTATPKPATLAVAGGGP